MSCADFQFFLLQCVITIHQRYRRTDGRRARSILIATCIYAQIECCAKKKIVICGLKSKINAENFSFLRVYRYERIFCRQNFWNGFRLKFGKEIQHGTWMEQPSGF